MFGRRVVALLLMAGTGVLPAACSGGSRPELSEPDPVADAGAPVGEPGVDAVLTLLESPTDASFTATYALVLRLGNVSSSATVALDDAGRRSVTIGSVRFLSGGDQPEQTCRLGDGGGCEEGILEARTSDLGFSSGFATDVPARRLRIAWERRAGEPLPDATTIAGIDATCVSVPVGTGVESYCAIAPGILARWAAADVIVELESFRDGADAGLFSER